MLKTRPRSTPAPTSVSDDEIIRKLRAEVVELRAENDELRRCFSKDPDRHMWWSLSKVHRQADANAAMCARLTRLRFQLREITRLGRALSTEEFRDALARVEREDVRTRIAEGED